MFYTYLWLREDGTPYYVGKGTGKRAFRKGSPSADKVLLQEFLSEDEAFIAEQLLIAVYGRKDLGTGCLRNLTDGGDNPPSRKGVSNPHTDEWRKKIGEGNKGKVRSPEFKAYLRSVRMSQTPPNTGRKFSEQARKNMSAAHVGKTQSEDTKRKLSEIVRRRWQESAC